jgi:hypothetical protein
LKNKFEGVFSDFVTEFGGEVLPEPADSKIADYFFRKQNIVAELKCLVEDQTDTMNKKIAPIILDWVRKHKELPSGCDGKHVEIAKVPKDISDRWLEVLKAPVENIIRDANRQIRETKKRLNAPDAKGLLLVFNQGNQLHNRPKDFIRLLGIVRRKRKPDKQLKFPHVNCLVYFSYETVKAENEKMSFWAPMQLRDEPNEDVTQMRNFQKELQQGWYAFVEKTSGRTVRQHDVE